MEYNHNYQTSTNIYYIEINKMYKLLVKPSKDKETKQTKNIRLLRNRLLMIGVQSIYKQR